MVLQMENAAESKVYFIVHSRSKFLLPVAAHCKGGLGQHFQDLGHSFSLYGPPSQQITYIYFFTKRY